MQSTNKFQLFELVRIVKDHTGWLDQEIGFITDMQQFPWNGVWEYSVYTYADDDVGEFTEDALETTGEFLTQEEINERLKITSIKNKFSNFEIVEVIFSKNPNYLGKKGYIFGMAQNDSNGSWTYGVSLFDYNGDNYSF